MIFKPFIFSPKKHFHWMKTNFGQKLFFTGIFYTKINVLYKYSKCTFCTAKYLLVRCIKCTFIVHWMYMHRRTCNVVQQWVYIGLLCSFVLTNWMLESDPFFFENKSIRLVHDCTKPKTRGYMWFLNRSFFLPKKNFIGWKKNLDKNFFTGIFIQKSMYFTSTPNVHFALQNTYS